MTTLMNRRISIHHRKRWYEQSSLHKDSKLGLWFARRCLYYVNNNCRKATATYLRWLKEQYQQFGDDSSVLTMDICLAAIKGGRYELAVNVFKREFKELISAYKKKKNVKGRKSGEKITSKKRFNPARSDFSSQAGTA